MYLALDEGGDVFLVVEDGQRLEQVVLQPLPVCRYLFVVGTWGRGGKQEGDRAIPRPWT